MSEPILSTDRVTADGAQPRAWLYVLHGIYGAGRNWGSVIRRVVRQRPEWGALLVDLREHGASQGFDPPHTVARAAADVERLAEHNGLHPDAVLGHSFGGKVALVYAREASDPPRQVWVVDSTPRAHEPDGTAWKMLGLIEAMPRRFDSRDEFVDLLVERGQQRPVAQWMATNLVSDGAGRFTWRIRFEAMRELLVSFYETDAWDGVEAPAAGTEVHLVRARESSVLSGATLERAQRAADRPAGADGGGRAFLHTVDGGHWVNAENPAAIESLLVQMLPSV